MFAGGLLGSLSTILVDSGTVVQPLKTHTCLDCQSHLGLRMSANTFGHMQEGSRRAVHMTVTVHVLLAREPTNRHLFAKTFTAKLPHSTHLQNMTGSGTPTTLSGMERTAILEAAAAITESMVQEDTLGDDHGGHRSALVCHTTSAV